MAASSSSGWAFLSRKPLAPARKAGKTDSSTSNVVSTTTRGAAAPSRSISSRVAATPSSRGMRTSISTTSHA